MMWRLLPYKTHSWVATWLKAKAYFKIHCFRRRMFIKTLYLLKIDDASLVILCVAVPTTVSPARLFELIPENLEGLRPHNLLVHQKINKSQSPESKSPKVPAQQPINSCLHRLRGDSCCCQSSTSKLEGK